mgnify:CR=1 FL=1
MIMKQIVDDMNNNVVRMSEYDFNTIRQASERLNRGDLTLSQHELAAAAIVNNRMDLLEEADARRYFIRMGRNWAHATIEMIFDHWEREMELPSDDPQCPKGDQRIFTRG